MDVLSARMADAPVADGKQATKNRPEAEKAKIVQLESSSSAAAKEHQQKQRQHHQQQQQPQQQEQQQGRGKTQEQQQEGAASMAKVLPGPSRMVLVGNTRYPVCEMPDSGALLRAGDWAALRARLARDGFLRMSGALPRAQILAARRKLLSQLQKRGALDVSGARCADHAVIAKGADGLPVADFTVDAQTGGLVADREPESAIPSWRATGTSKEVAGVYDGSALRELFGHLFGAGFTSLPACTWLRAKGARQMTVEHADYYYFRGNTDIFSSNVDEKQRGEAPVAEKRLAAAAAAAAACAASATPSKPEEGEQEEAGAEQLRCAAGPDCLCISSADDDNSSSQGFRAKGSKAKMDEKTKKKERVCSAQEGQQQQKKKQHAPPSTIQCTLCSRSFHLTCTQPALRRLPGPGSGEWHCCACANSPLPFYTCWIPLGSVEPVNGTLAVAPGTHKLVGFEKPLSGKPLLPRKYAQVKSKLMWCVPTRMQPGDLILFNIKTVHGATLNETAAFRLSLDTRVCAEKFRQGPPPVYVPVSHRPKKSGRRKPKRRRGW